MYAFVLLAALCVATLPAEAQSVRRSAQSSAAASIAPCRESRRAITKKWRQFRCELGKPVSRQIEAKHGGHYVRYEHGFVFWRADLGAHAVYGAIAQKWEELGRETGFGYPIADEASAPDGARFSEFEGERSIYWSAATDAHAVSGPIRAQWLADGGAKGGIGNPSSDPYRVGADQRCDFENGYIVWFGETATTLSAVGERCMECGDGRVECGVSELCAPQFIEVTTESSPDPLL